MRRAAVLVVLALLAVAAAYTWALRSSAAEQSRFLGTWEMAGRPSCRWIVFREDGTGTLSDLDDVSHRPRRAQEMVWSVDPARRTISIRVLPGRGSQGTEEGGRYQWYGRNLEIHHGGGTQPGTFLYVKAE